MAALRARPGYRLVESTIADADLPALLDGVTHVFHLAAQAGVRKSWGREFAIYTSSTWTRRRFCSRPASGRPIERVVYASSSSVYGDEAALPMNEEAPAAPGVAVRRHQAGRRAALSSLFRESRRADRVASLLHGLRPAAAAGHGLSPLFLGLARWPAAHPVRRRPADARLHLRRRCRLGDARPRPSAACPAASTISGVGSRVSLKEVFDLSAGSPVATVRIDQPARAEGRHARHLRRYDAGTGRPRVPPSVTLEARPARNVLAGWKRRKHDVPDGHAVVIVTALLGCGCRSAPAEKAGRVPPGTAEADKFLYERGAGVGKQREVGRRARIFPQHRRQLPAESVPPGREAGAR